MHLMLGDGSFDVVIVDAKCWPRHVGWRARSPNAPNQPLMVLGCALCPSAAAHPPLAATLVQPT